MDEHGRKLYWGWQYWDQHYQYNPNHHTAQPTPRPTFVPTPFPTPRPTPNPTYKPTYMPTAYPSPRPTPHPTARPSPRPTKNPTNHPIPLPTRKPTPNPTPNPTPSPTLRPTPTPTKCPTHTPTESPTHNPTHAPTDLPSASPTPAPTATPSEEPTFTPEPTEEESEEPTETTEPSANPTSFTSFSGSYTDSFASGCDGTPTLYDIICAASNANVLGELCTEVQAQGLQSTLEDCNRRLTIFAPINTAFDTFFNYFNDAFFSDPSNYPLQSIGDIVLDPSTIPSNRELQVNEDFRNSLVEHVLAYHIVNGIVTRSDLECLGTGRFINMLSLGTTETKCDIQAQGSLIGQSGTCNAPDFTPLFGQVDIQTGNGIMHVITQVMLPSPNATIAGCDLIGEGGAGGVAGRLFFVASPP